jgi:hypothetical protein
MQNRLPLSISSIFTIFIFIHFPGPLEAQQTVNHSGYASLLKAHVNHGHVDYKGFKEDEKKLDQYLALLERVSPQQLDRDEQMAFYINVYNAWTIKLVLNNYPGVKSIKDLGTIFKSPWKKKFVKINAKTVTLDYVEHEILRPKFKDPRVHFAVNCASISCPPLLNEPYYGANLEAQLDGVAKNFINDPDSNFVKNEVLYVSRIFKWFGEDFDNDILKYVRTHAQGDLAQEIENAKDTLKIKYLDYDWSLNGS